MHQKAGIDKVPTFDEHELAVVGLTHEKRRLKSSMRLMNLHLKT